MCGGAAAELDYAFRPDVKCCSFTPTLPNFTVGRILSARDTAGKAGRASVAARLEARRGVTPLGIAPEPHYRLLYEHGGRDGFGRSRALRCPHFVEEGGLCGIWAYREATCATYFCKYVRGAVGQALWKTMRHLLATVERALARWCVAEIGLPATTLERLFPVVPPEASHPLELADLDRESPAAYAELWGPWLGRERELYAECARRVEPLTWDDVVRVGGPDVRLAAAMARAAYDRALDASVPSPVVPAGFRLVSIADGTVRLLGYSATDVLELPDAILEVLHHFDGRPTPEVLASLEADGVELDADTVRLLADFAILREKAR
jgi:Fe-S-cluster containining protein